MFTYEWGAEFNASMNQVACETHFRRRRAQVVITLSPSVKKLHCPCITLFGVEPPDGASTGEMLRSCAAAFAAAAGGAGARLRIDKRNVWGVKWDT